MKWCSIDPANPTGIAYWEYSVLKTTSVFRKMGAKGKFFVGGIVFNNRWAAWNAALAGQRLATVEEGFGRFATAIKSQADIRGYIKAVCDFRTNEKGHTTHCIVVNVSEWRRVIKEAYGVSWPATTERKKALSKQLVKQHYGLDVSDDESDAVLLGVAAMRMGVVPLQERETTEGAK